MRLTDARVVVTGASRGIGERIARRCAARGADVVLIARSRTVVEALASEIGGTAVAADLSDRAVVDGLIDEIEADGPIDVLVNNAGIGLARGICAIDADLARAVYEVNLIAPTELSRQAARHMLERNRGRIVNVSSISAAVTGPGMSVYAASKAGITQFTEGLRLDLRGSAVGVTLVEIGPVRTEMIGEFDAHPPTKALMDRFKAMRAVVDLEPDDVAARIVAAIEGDERSVRMPALATMLHGMPSLPRRFTEIMLRGIDSSPLT